MSQQLGGVLHVVGAAVSTMGVGAPVTATQPTPVETPLRVVVRVQQWPVAPAAPAQDPAVGYKRSIFERKAGLSLNTYCLASSGHLSIRTSLKSRLVCWRERQAKCESITAACRRIACRRGSSIGNRSGSPCFSNTSDTGCNTVQRGRARATISCCTNRSSAGAGRRLKMSY